MSYYKVKAYAGHEGAGKSKLLTFAIEADSITGAITIARKMPMVKHTRNNAIKSCELISKETFDILRQDSAYKDCKGYKENRE